MNLYGGNCCCGCNHWGTRTKYTDKSSLEGIPLVQAIDQCVLVRILDAGQYLFYTL